MVKRAAGRNEWRSLPLAHLSLVAYVWGFRFTAPPATFEPSLTAFNHVSGLYSTPSGLVERCVAAEHRKGGTSMRGEPVFPGAFFNKDGNAVGESAMVNNGKGRSGVVMDERSIFQRLQQFP